MYFVSAFKIYCHQFERYTVKCGHTHPFCAFELSTIFHKINNNKHSTDHEHLISILVIFYHFKEKREEKDNKKVDFLFYLVVYLYGIRVEIQY